MILPDELRSLSPDEKLAIVTGLWDDLASSDVELRLPPGELEELDRRREQLEREPSIALDQDEVWRRVDGD